MSGNKGGVTKSSTQRTILTDKEFSKIMLGQQYKMDGNDNLIIIDPVTLAEQDLADINLESKPKPKHNNVRGGKSKRKKSRSKKYKKRRVNKTRRYRK